jgi:2-amino-4-hydroxy-6-hydroxymethyldihydropteridine diphosphokinase
VTSSSRCTVAADCTPDCTPDCPTPQQALIALGSNLNAPLEQLRHAAQRLQDLGRMVKRSGVYRTAPVGGPEGQADYLNAVVVLEPHVAYTEPRVLLQALHRIEAEQGRERRVRWEARTLDLDLLAYGARRILTADLTLPHPRMMERAFVLAPLCEALPSWRHPVTGEGACEGLERLGRGGVVRTELCWDE